MPLTRSMRASNSPAASASPAASSLRESEGQHFIEVPDPDFHDFDGYCRAAEDIAPGQTWAIYDDKDGMPRYYARIRRVSVSPFEVEFWWLASERASEESNLWTKRSGYYNTTGKFENGDLSTEKLVNIFSHRMYITEQFVLGAPTRIIIHPRKGDVWAMYRDWDEVQAITSSESPSSVACKFDMVEILVDYTKKNGVKTVKLAKVPGFRNVFHRQDGRRAIRTWGTSDLVRFSHNVPIATKKLIGVYKKAIELDPAATPLDCSTDGLENGYGHPERQSEMGAENAAGSRDSDEESEHENGTRPCPSTGRQHKPIIDVVVRRASLRQSSVKSQIPNTDIAFTDVIKVDKGPRRQESSIFPSILPLSVAQIPPFQSGTASQESDFYDFGSLRTETDIEAGQIWATYDVIDRMPRNYVRVVQVLESPFKVDVWRLKSQPLTKKALLMGGADNIITCGDHPITCGSFKNDKRDVMGLECFSHLVLDRAKDCVNIFPKKGEVWAMYRNWDLENGGTKVQRGLGTFHLTGYDLVEFFSDFLEDGSLQLVRLDKVTGFKSLFQRQRTPLVFEKPTVGPDFFLGFSHSISSRKMYRDDKLRIPFGALEVDPACITL